MSPAEAKRRIRRDVRETVRRLSASDRDHLGCVARSTIAERLRRTSARRILLYVSFLPEEIDTAPLIDQVLRSGRILLLPRTRPDRSGLDLLEIRDPATELTPGALGIPEPHAAMPQSAPNSVEWALVPGLAFTPCGDRLGRGAGLYDRLLSELPRATETWSVCFTEQILTSLPVEYHDRRVGAIATPHASHIAAADFSSFSAT